MYCDICKKEVDERGYTRHCSGKTHKKLAALKKKEEKQEETCKKPQPTAGEEENALPEITPEEQEENITYNPEEPEETKQEKRNNDYVELRIVDGHPKEEKVKSGIEALFEKFATPENIAVIGQVVGQIIASKLQTPAVSAPQWGCDDKGNPISF